jgi:hypothetical protein
MRNHTGCTHGSSREDPDSIAERPCEDLRRRPGKGPPGGFDSQAFAEPENLLS